MSNEDLSRELASLVRSLREDVARLAERVAALEAALPAAGAPGQIATSPNGGPPPAPEAAPDPGAPAVPANAAGEPAAAASPAGQEEISEEVLLVISAAIAAYLGKKPYIRQIRLVASPTWSHQGRVSIQASHALALHSRTGASL